MTQVYSTSEPRVGPNQKGLRIVPWKRGLAHAVDFKLGWGPGEEKEEPHHD